MEFARRAVDVVHSPIGAAHGLLTERRGDRHLLDLSQAAPSVPAAPEVTGRIAEVAHEPDGGFYAPQPGLPALREAFAADLTAGYASPIDAGQVLITAGCNQAFCIAASVLTDPGDEMVVASPYYFNHDMWLRHIGVVVRHLPSGTDHQPDLERAEQLLSPRTRAIVLVSPGNPTGVTIAPDRLAGFAQLAHRAGAALILDETYRTFRPTADPPHSLFADPAWTDTVVSLHSFSKDFAIPGYRVGAIVGGSALLLEALKVLDCVAICAPRIGQEAALAGLRHAAVWRKDQVSRVAELHDRFVAGMRRHPGGFELVTSGAYFGWVRHPFGSRPATDVVRALALDHDVLVVPGTAFTRADEAMLRFSFANLTAEELDELPRRLDEAR